MFEEVDEGHVEGEEKLVFRYNREERLRNAPQIVRDAYEGKMNPVRGFKVLWVNKSNRYILLSLIIFIGFVWVFTAISNTKSYAKINNIAFEINAFSFQDEVYVTLKVNDKKADEKSAPVKVDAEVFFINNDNQIIEKKELSLVYGYGEQTLATKTRDYDIIRVDAIIDAANKEKEVTVAVKH
ncbi:MAG: hypothetical protein J6T20_02025 [Treponema sp.]|nr:hypothetical protein [Treponema sp.]